MQQSRRILFQKPLSALPLVHYLIRTARLSFIVTIMLCWVALALPDVAGAVTTISQGFLTKGKATIGSIVSLDSDTSDYVSPTATSNISNIIGVVIPGENSLLSVSSGKSSQVQVATSGVVPVLVSDINGDIKVGDQITGSPISGVGMKATSNTEVVGTAQGDLQSSANSKEDDYTDQSGKKHHVLLGSIPVLISVSYYFKQPDKTLIPAAIQNIANALAGKTVNTLPILISVGIFIVTLLVVTTIIYSMIHGSIVSVGRNPMSQAAIYRNLIQLSALVVIILAVAVVSIYLVLTRF